MITFHLGVIDIPYGDENTTTSDVAVYLEEKYQIMQTFFDRYGNDIAELMSKDLAANLENMLAGAPPSRDPLAESMSRIHDLFVAFLDNGEMNGMPGVPTRRALLGDALFSQPGGARRRPGWPVAHGVQPAAQR
ncbi:hypothetical protein ABZ352_39075 [Streptomyces griseofuscus]|uniref:hypothetical protein n=1 Tax=Streptomyces griseofuscus TaxID=146922 RepID=UPI0033EC9E54